MTFALLRRQLLRELGGGRGRALFFVVSLAVGVAAVVAVAGFTEGLDRGIRSEARQLLAADLVIRGLRPTPDAALAVVDAIAGSERTSVLELLTVVAVRLPDGGPGPSQLVELRAVSGTYPFYGRLELEPAGTLAALLAADDAAVAAPELLTRLGIGVGDELRIGGASFHVAGVVRSEPDRIAGAFNLGPRLFVSGAGLARAGLEQTGSRIFRRTLVKLPDGTPMEEVSRRLRDAMPPNGRWRVESFREAQPELRRGLRRVERFLGLAALLSLLVGGVGVAQTVRAWLAARLDAIAVLRCLGLRPREILVLYLALAAGLATVASLLGIALGLGLQVVAAKALAGVLPVELLRLWQPWAIARGLALGLGVALLFSLPPIAAARRVPPIRVLRRDAEPLPPSRAAVATTAAALVAGIFALAVTQSRSLELGAAFTAGLLALVALLAVSARGLVRLAARPRSRASGPLRHGLAALARPGAATLGGVVALGLGTMVVLSMRLVELHVSRELRRDLPANAPSAFLIDVQPDQWPGVERVLEEEGSTAIDSVPVVTARLRAIDGKTIEEILGPRRDDGEEAAEEEDDRGRRRQDGRRRDRWALEREQRLTYLERLPADNRVVAGALWSRSDLAEVSLEKDFADDLEVGLGTVLRFDVQGVPVELTVTSLRTVDWESFGINFFMVVEPGVLDEAPQLRVAAARLPAGGEGRVQDRLAREFPNVTLIRIREVLEKVAGILDRLSTGVRVLGLVTVVAGLAILAGAASAAATRRGGEVALLKVLGMTRLQVVGAFAVEHALVGAVAALVGGIGAAILGYVVVTRGMEMDWRFPALDAAAILVVTVALATVAGLASSVPALQRRPVEALRSE